VQRPADLDAWGLPHRDIRHAQRFTGADNEWAIEEIPANARASVSLVRALAAGGSIEAARANVPRPRALDPGFRIETWRRYPFKRAEDRELAETSLRRADPD
jgi:hypothetical protein